MNLYGVDFLRSLYVEDGSHPSESGAYMAACVIYATIHDADPSLITWKTSGLTSDQAAKIRNAAKVAINSYNKRIAA